MKEGQAGKSLNATHANQVGKNQTVTSVSLILPMVAPLAFRMESGKGWCGIHLDPGLVE